MRLLALISIFLMAGGTLTGARQGVPATDSVEPAVEAVQPRPEVSGKIEAFHPPAVTIGDARHYSPPDFRRYENTSARKRAFFEYMIPRIHAANEEVMREREWLLGLGHQLLDGRALTEVQRSALSRAEMRYALNEGEGTDAERVGRLLKRVDIVPESLVIAQAAKESGWGTSRFAREGNNFFGIWCFYEGCGMKPLRRAEGRTHEVAMFDTVEEGVRYYIRTINTHAAYEDLREMRAEARRRQQRLPGEQLAVGLMRYSERGHAYVKEIQSMIRYNQLSRFTRSYSA